MHFATGSPSFCLGPVQRENSAVKRWKSFKKLAVDLCLVPFGSQFLEAGCPCRQCCRPLPRCSQVVKVFMDQNRLQETTSIMLDALKASKELDSVGPYVSLTKVEDSEKRGTRDGIRDAAL